MSYGLPLRKIINCLFSAEFEIDVTSFFEDRDCLHIGSDDLYIVSVCLYIVTMKMQNGGKHQSPDLARFA